MRTDLFHVPSGALYHSAAYATNRTLVPIPARQLANIQMEYQWLGPSSVAYIKSRLTRMLYPPVWGDQGEETPLLTVAEQETVSAYFREHFIGESEDVASYHGQEKHDLSFDHQAYTESLRDIANSVYRNLPPRGRSQLGVDDVNTPSTWQRDRLPREFVGWHRSCFGQDPTDGPGPERNRHAETKLRAVDFDSAGFGAGGSVYPY